MYASMQSARVGALWTSCTINTTSGCAWYTFPHENEAQRRCWADLVCEPRPIPEKEGGVKMSCMLACKVQEWVHYGLAALSTLPQGVPGTLFRKKFGPRDTAGRIWCVRPGRFLRRKKGGKSMEERVQNREKKTQPSPSMAHGTP